MSLFHVLNEGVIKILGFYFEMQKNEATRSLSIYKTFCEQAIKINGFFDIARKLRNELGIDIPDIKHVHYSSHSILNLIYSTSHHTITIYSISHLYPS